jgi:5-(carboxyamino)imidazole ribonucleotide synthase
LARRQPPPPLRGPDQCYNTAMFSQFRPSLTPTLSRREKAGRPSVGILGGGQLARMTAQAAVELGVDIFVLEREAVSPAGQIVGADHEVVGDWRDRSALAQLAEKVDLITLENEFVDPDALDWLVDRGRTVYPGPDTLRIVGDKLRQKEALSRAGLPVPRFRAVESEPDVIAAGHDFDWPIILKSRRLGYDGHGNVLIQAPERAGEAIARLARPSGQRPGMTEARDLFVESFVPFAGELAVMVARGRAGEMAVYPLVETFQRDHICHEVVVPARVSADVERQARDVAARAVAVVDAVGIVGVELFWLADGSVFLNELAPRPHNSGHYTIEGCDTSQFANHLRAVLGWPLGPTDLVAPAVAMVNLLGTVAGPAAPAGIDEASATEGAFVHLYGKREVRPGRKMGHVTALGSTPDGALALARRVAARITW